MCGEGGRLKGENDRRAATVDIPCPYHDGIMDKKD